jgi:hypothetical protein
MKEQEYKDELDQLEKNFQSEKKYLAIRYANKNNPYMVGDVITDHIGSGKIISWFACMGSYSLPSLIYRCENLTKKGTTNKREPKRDIYQSNIE